MKLTKLLLIITISLFIITSLETALILKALNNKVTDLEKNYLYLNKKTEQIESETQKQSRIIAQDLLIISQGFKE